MKYVSIKTELFNCVNHNIHPYNKTVTDLKLYIIISGFLGVVNYVMRYGKAGVNHTPPIFPLYKYLLVCFYSSITIL